MAECDNSNSELRTCAKPS